MFVILLVGITAVFVCLGGILCGAMVVPFYYQLLHCLDFFRVSYGIGFDF